MLESNTKHPCFLFLFCFVSFFMTDELFPLCRKVSLWLSRCLLKSPNSFLGCSHYAFFLGHLKLKVAKCSPCPPIDYVEEASLLYFNCYHVLSFTINFFKGKLHHQNIFFSFPEMEIKSQYYMKTISKGTHKS